MSKQTAESGLDRWIGRLSLVVALAALYFAWQANTIAQEANSLVSKQIQAQIVVSMISDYGSGKVVFTGDGGTAECSTKLRLSNLGGATTVLTDYRVFIEFGDKSLQLQSYGASEAKGSSDGIGRFKQFRVSLLREDQPIFSYDVVNQDYQLKMPAPFDPFSIKDIYSRMGFSFDGKPEFTREATEGFTPLTAIFTLTMSSGQVVTSPRLTCRHIKF